jgi:hypothetical protein
MGRRGLLVVNLMAALAACAALGGSASAALAPSEALTYMPTEAFYSQRSPAEVDDRLQQLADYGVGQALFNTPRLKGKGTLVLNGAEEQMLSLWSQRAAATGTSVVAVLNGHPKGRVLNLEKPATRANVVAAAEHLVSLGVDGVQLDFEPFPMSPGFIALLEELHAAFVRQGFAGRLSVVAPGNLATWSPSYLAAVSASLQQIDPTFYDSESSAASEYEQWLREGLAHYSAGVPSSVRLIPVIPSYRKNPWHLPAVENIATATAAIEGALGEGSRVNGAGIWWWYGFYDDERGRYDASADRAAWLGTTLGLSFTP